MKNSTEEERKAFVAAMGAAKFRGFKIGVSADGALTATAPKPTVKSYVADHGDSAKRHRKFIKAFMGGSGTAKS